VTGSRDAAGAVPAVRAEHLDVGYDGRTVVGDVHLELAAGRSLALVGTNGSGKSTLLRTLVGLLPPVAGRLEILGAPPGRSPSRVGYLGQFHSTGSVLPLRSVDVVRMGRFPRPGLLGRLGRVDEQVVQESMARTGVAHLRDVPVRVLSGGQRQRVHLAQVLAREADLLVLDEPTAGLDAGGREVYLEAAASERARGAALVTATHDIGEALQADAAMLIAGRVVASGHPEDVLTPEHLLETFGVALQTFGSRIVSVERDHSHDDSHEH
jgi:ABC-type Mn2+/Zn2+ transport system ATPase subunit